MDPKKLLEMVKAKKAAMKRFEKTLKPNPGDNRYVILPGWRPGDEAAQFWHDFGQHFFKDAAGEILAIYPCAKEIYGEPCDACMSLSHAGKEAADDATVKLLSEAKSSKNYLLNVLALDTSDPKTPQILELRPSAFSNLLTIFEKWGPQMFDPTNPQVITITRDGKGLNTKYTVNIDPERVEMPAGTLGKLHNLDEYVKQDSEEKQKKALSAIRIIAGALPAPTAGRPALSADKPATRDTESPSVASRNAATAATPAADDLALDAELGELLGTL